MRSSTCSTARFLRETAMSSRSREGWTRVAFGDVVRQVKDRVDPATAGIKRYVAGEHMDTDDLRIRRWGTVGDGYLGPAFHMRFRPGQVLYGSRRTYLRKVAVAPFEGITANTTFVLESRDHTRFLPELLPFLMQTDAFNEYSIGESKGSVNPYINFSDLARYEFALPPIEEQRRMVEALSALDRVGETYRAFRRAALGVSRSVVEAAMRNVVQVSVRSLLIESPKNGVSPPAVETGGDRWTVSVSAVRDGSFNPAGCTKPADIVAAQVEPFLVRAGDVFVVRGNGNRKLCGSAGISEQSYDDIFYPDLLIRLRFDVSQLLPEFAVGQWNLPSVHARLSSRAKSSNGIWKVNGQDIRVHTLAVPPLDVQREVVEVLHAVGLRIGGIDARLAGEAALKRELAAPLGDRR